MKKLGLIILAIVLFATPALCSEKTYTISVNQIVEHPALDALRQGFMDSLKEQGIKAEYNVHIAQGNAATNTQIASQILGEQPDLVLAISTSSAQVVAQKVKDRPILFTGVTDPVTAGLVKSLENPGANVSGMTDMSPMKKHVELIREILPSVKSIGVIYNSGEPNSIVLVNLLKKYSSEQDIGVVEGTIANSSGVYQAAKSLVGRADVIYVPTDNTVVSAIESAVKVCNQNHIPLIAGDVDSVKRGAVAALAVDYYLMGRQTGEMGGRVLRDGMKPADMPVESSKQLRLYINKKSSKSMGVKLPDSVISRADKIIE